MSERLTDEELEALIQRFDRGHHPKVAAALAELRERREKSAGALLAELLERLERLERKSASGFIVGTFGK